MGLTWFPNGIKTPLMVGGASTPEIPYTSGSYFFVSSTYPLGSDSNAGTDPQAPLATIDAAIGKCTASHGDVIVVLPYHAENVIVASGITCDIAGVQIIGLGTGSQRPTITFTTANTATIVISAADVTWKNFLFIGNFLSIAKAFAPSAAGTDFTLDTCEFRDASDVLCFLSVVTTTATTSANGLTIKNCYRQSIAATTPGPFLSVLGTIDRVQITDNLFVHGIDGANLPVVMSQAALVVTNLLMARNRVYCVHANTSSGGLLIVSTATTGSGVICDNYVRSQDPAGAIMVSAAAIQYGMFNNLHTGETTLLSATILPAAGSDT